jgi:hypothetical protein
MEITDAGDCRVVRRNECNSDVVGPRCNRETPCGRIGS